ncbi:MAG: hypothetical protein FD152_1324 [Xanthobacteraceae bacterium]|nr:MAG: hypothetical protein FD152_1324 [Xanthobacteraceae bacterium]
MTPPFDTDLWRRRADLRRKGLSVREIALREGIRPQSIAKGFQRMRYLGFDVPADRNKGGRPAAMQVVGVDPAVYGAIRGLALKHGMTTTKAVRIILKTAVVDHPQIAANILDPEA